MKGVDSLWATIQAENPHCQHCLKAKPKHKSDCRALNPIWGIPGEWHMIINPYSVFGYVVSHTTNINRKLAYDPLSDIGNTGNSK